ncbi:MAG: YlbF family regulator, partial [Firmicutes bacterium]|nr:YlbF family regulator [Bacillota bacterium]
AVLDNEEAQTLIQAYSELKDAFQAELAKKPLDNDAVAKAGEAVKAMEDKLSDNALINEMREKSADYSDLMQDLNAVIGRVVNGEPEDSCSGGCAGCGGSCSH